MSNLQSCLVWTGKTHLCVFPIENNLGRLIWCRSIKTVLFAYYGWIQDCFCILHDVTSFISRCRFSFQLNVLYGWFYWINSTVRLETRLEKRFEENKMLHKETLNSSEYCKIPLQKSCQRRLCRGKEIKHIMGWDLQRYKMMAKIQYTICLTFIKHIINIRQTKSWYG